MIGSLKKGLMQIIGKAPFPVRPAPERGVPSPLRQPDAMGSSIWAEPKSIWTIPAMSEHFHELVLVLDMIEVQIE